MMCELFYLAMALFFKKNNPEQGLDILKDPNSKEKLPDIFWVWFYENEVHLREKLSYYSSKGIHFTYPGCWDYPLSFLNNLDSTPLMISYMGSPNWLKNPGLGVVGSRKISNLTKSWMEQELLPFLNRNEVNIISGGARGVDQYAHLCSLRAKRPTFVFLPSGLEAIYPRDLNEWKSQIIKEGGAFLSEYWPTEEIKKHYFVERNRLIAAMSDFVLIVQGERKSGTLLTAQWALDLGRDIGTLPAHPMDTQFSGNLQLIRSGVPMVNDSMDLENIISGCRN